VRADRLDGGAAVTDDDAFLRLPFDEQGDPNVHGPFGFAKLLHLGGKGIGELVTQELEGGFPQILDYEETEWLGADVLRIVLERSLREEGS
jgi:hypothetical protein